MISICTPTRNRPELFKRFCESVWSTVSNKDNVEISVYRDDDDESVYEYLGNYILTTGKRIYPDTAYNECQKVAHGPIYVFSPDDMIFRTPGWDIMMQEAFDKSDDKIIYAYLNDGKFGSKYGVVGGLHKNWIDAVGYFFYPEACRGGDVRINRIAKRLGRLVYLGDARIKDTRVVDDKTHLEYADTIKKNVDRLWNSEEMVTEQKRAQECLKNFINTYQKNV